MTQDFEFLVINDYYDKHSNFDWNICFFLTVKTESTKKTVHKEDHSTAYAYRTSQIVSFVEQQIT